LVGLQSKRNSHKTLDSGSSELYKPSQKLLSKLLKI
jgi:hypothetical protein